MTDRHARPGRDTPFRILVTGDFGGASGRAADAGARRLRTVAVDRDNVEDVLASIAPTLALENASGSRLEVTFKELDDFHPDRLVLRVESLRRLRDLRSRLRQSALFDEAAEELAALIGPTAEESAVEADAVPEPARGPDGESVTAADLFGASLAATDDRQVSGATDWDVVVRDLVSSEMRGLRISKESAEQAQCVERLDAVIAAELRRILHHPSFQALEASWRSLYTLVRRLRTDSKLKVFLLDASADEVFGDLGSSKDLRETGLYRLLVEPSVEIEGGEPWAAVVADYTFDALPRDVLFLSRLARLAAAAGAALVAGARAGVFGCESLGDTPHPSDWTKELDQVGGAAWAQLRALPAIGHVCLTWPRVLLRLPYGEAHDATEDVPFEEQPGVPIHDACLWGNAAYIAAEALAAAFERHGWDLRPEVTFERGDLPALIYEDDDGERVLAACGEALLTERAVGRIDAMGVVPVLSIRGQAAVRLGALHSLAGSEYALAGPWG